ncbi:transcriptional regulator [Anaerocolumna cellulosilytica]|uniref:Transcriptional regulator n=1 Tax=Anaerocolumna cellulosilytica TaxID=433286 RepID=A0A6S6QYR4_9FIRM|nr:metalloregulator ArsR/SmtB family transcription factor [Anaerocolumna cellulosilytica]MBB5196833.1 DNA-binding transcriptional ArsR family regulator [Anaerocolumna cellulosilytica]BCJ95774.1 transcriptional regulator [Anaerocolumna cellulosilytica]
MENYVIQKTPLWMLEAVESILDVENTRIQEVINNSEKFGMNDIQMKEYLLKLIEFKKRVTEDNLNLLEKYPVLKPYFVKTEFEKDNLSLLSCLVHNNQERLEKDLSVTDIDEMIDSLVKDILELDTREILSDKFKISNISDIISVLRKMEVDDGFKLRMIELYSDRYKVFNEMQQFLKAASEIVKAHFSVIQEDFENYVELMKDKDAFYKGLEDNKTLRFETEVACKIQPTIICFNQLTVTSKVNTRQFIIGIYLNDLLKRKNMNEFNDTQLTADLKAIGDATRLKILHLLSGKELYLQEMADALKLTPATVSHHMNILLQSEMVCITVNIEKAKKVYYSLNPVKLTELGETIKRLAVTV